MGLLSEEELKAFEEESQARKVKEFQDWKGQTAQLFCSGLVSGCVLSTFMQIPIRLQQREMASLVQDDRPRHLPHIQMIQFPSGIYAAIIHQIEPEYTFRELARKGHCST